MPHRPASPPFASQRPAATQHGWLLRLMLPMLLLASCQQRQPQLQSTLTVSDALAGGDTAGYARAVVPRPFVFPADHGPHPAFRSEWWYFTGNLAAADGRRFGYQFTIFRSALAPPDSTPERASAWGAGDLYMVHFALTDVADARFFAQERFARGGGGMAGATVQPHIRVWLEDWQMQSLQSGRLFPLRLTARDPQYAIDLTLDSLKPLVLQGDRGLSQKSATPGNASYYYSATRIGTRGNVAVQGDTFAVRGNSWLDREWSTSALGDEQVGWDWFALQLSDRTELMYYQLRRTDGSADPASKGTWVAADGSSRTLPRDSVQLQVLRHWQHPRSGIRYPAAWQVRVPSRQLELRVTPLVADQELPTGIRYWEGAVRIEGIRAGKPVNGSGYVELTGYDQALRQASSLSR